MQDFGDLIRRSREQKNVRGYDLAYALGQNPSWLSRLESGALTHPPSPSVMDGLRDQLGIPIAEMFAAMGYAVDEPGRTVTLDPVRSGLIRRVERVRLLPERVGALGGLWTSTEIHEMFQTPFYAGYATHKGIIVAEGKHEALVTPEEFSAAQERAKRIANVRNVSPHQITSWLEGLVEHECGARMYLSHTYGPKKMDGTRNTFANFVCKNASGIHACGLPQVSISKRKLEAAVRKCLITDLKNIVTLDDAVARAEQEAGGQPAKDARREIETRRAKLNRRYDRARELWLDGGDSLEQWKQTKAEHDAEIAALDAELANLPAPPDPNRFRDAATMLGSFAAVAIQASDDALKLALEQLGIVVVSGDGVRIRYHHPYSVFLGDTAL